MFKNLIGEAAEYELLAEEGAELAKAALKVARIIRGENPTPITMDEAMANLVEEYTDVFIVSKDLNLNIDLETMAKKVQRGLYRLSRTTEGKNVETTENQPQ